MGMRIGIRDKNSAEILAQCLNSMAAIHIGKSLEQISSYLWVFSVISMVEWKTDRKVTFICMY
jgi:hypothetical protein